MKVFLASLVAGALALATVGVAQEAAPRADGHAEHLLPAVTPETYLRVLGTPPEALDPAEQRARARYIAQMAPLLDARADSRLSPSGAALPEEFVDWWNDQDPFPATPSNERLEEHLQRVAHAERAFATPDTDRGFDDRGDIYVRYGPPQRQTRISFNDEDLRSQLYDRGAVATLSAGDFPENVVWSYPGLGDAAYFIFLRKSRRYVLGTLTDLIPSGLRGAFERSPRGRARAALLISTLRLIYTTLAQQHPEFQQRYVELESYVQQTAEAETMALQQVLLQRQRLPLQSRTQNMVEQQQIDYNQALEVLLRQSGLDAQEQFAGRQLSVARVEERAALRRRQEEVPRHASRSLTVPAVPVAARIVRTLAEDGTTHLSLSWSHPGGSLGALQEDAAASAYLVSLSAVTHGGTQRHLLERRYLIPADLAHGRLPTQVQTVELPVHFTGDSTRAAVQWDFHAVESPGRTVSARRAVAAYAPGIVVPLSADPSRLEMSDLLPLVVGPDFLTREHDVTPYPFTTLTTRTPLALFFEAYHLTFGADDLTHYAAEIEVYRPGRRRGEARTATRADFTGEARRASHVLTLDLGDLPDAGTLVIRVRLTDEVSGQRVERLLTFDLE